MTPEQTKEAFAVMQAFVDGKRIQFKYNNKWLDIVGNSCWEWDSEEYRIKPETIKYRRWIFEGLKNKSVSIAMNDADVRFANSLPQFLRWIDNDWIEEEV